MTSIRLSDCELFVEQRGAGPVILLVHGFPLDHSMWREQIAALAPDFRVIAPDLRGFGRSGGAAETVTMAQFADDLAELLTVLDVGTRITFCGLSMGGYIAWQFWERHREKLARLILCDTRAAADTDTVASGRLTTSDTVLREGSGSLVDGMVDKLFSAATKETNRPVIEATAKVIGDAPPKGVSGALRGMAARPDMRRVVPQLNVPTLVICGSDDVITPASEMRDLAEQLPDSSFVEVPGAGHMAPLEKPAAVNAAIRDFLDQ